MGVKQNPVEDSRNPPVYSDLPDEEELKIN
jgi:hypothetical protein